MQADLRRRLTGMSLTFAAVGHGATDFVASNSTDEGRARNRRVTITFDT